VAWNLLFGVGFAEDPATYIGVSILLNLSAPLAAYVPAHRATRVDLMITLRCE
jgi:hypothetical protein